MNKDTKDNRSENTKEEDKLMAAISKPQESMMIAQGMTKAFIDLLVAQKRSETYWDECANTKKSIPSSAMDKLKKMCNGEDDV